MDEIGGWRGHEQSTGDTEATGKGVKEGAGIGKYVVGEIVAQKDAVTL